MAREVARGDVCLVNFPRPDKPRPVVVLTRTSAIRFLNRLTVAPVTSTIRSIPTEVVLGEQDGMKAPCAINLDHVLSVPKAALGRPLTSLDPQRMAKVCEALEFAVGCNS